MKINIRLQVQAPLPTIWSIITDYDHFVDNITGITDVIILERPPLSPDGTKPPSLLGLKWTEVRTMFGTEAKETMWVTECVPNKYYCTKAESHGAVYLSKMYVEEEGGVNYVGMEFEGEPQTLCGKVMMWAVGWIFVRQMEELIRGDLEDVKRVAESMVKVEEGAGGGDEVSQVEGEGG
ncbi:hypothetical protein ACHAXS_005544 [Conticribra weissflogii]